MKVIWHAGVDSRMIALKQAVILGVFDHLKQSLYVCVNHGLRRAFKAVLYCMPDKAHDGQNVALKCQGFHGALDRPTKEAGRSDDKSVICLQGFFISATYYTVV